MLSGTAPSSMRYAPIPGLSERVARVILGGLIFSPERADLTDALLDTYVAAGGNAIDTAHAYGAGASERALGDWLARHGRRADLIITTKGCHPQPEGPVRVGPASITSDLTESLARLRIETADIYLLHRDDPTAPVGPIVDCLNEHRAAGRIRLFGGSNWSTARLAEANAYAAARGLAGFAVSSPNLALAVPAEPMWPGCVSIAGDAEALAWYAAHRLPILAWSSQASGFFSGRFTPEVVDNPEVARVYYRPDNWERLARAREVAARHGCTPTQVALAWVLHHPLPTFALIGPRTVAELADCLGALAVALTPEEVRWLNLED